MFFKLLIYPGHYAGCWNLSSDKERYSLWPLIGKKYNEKQRSRLCLAESIFLILDVHTLKHTDEYTAYSLMTELQNFNFLLLHLLK